MPKRSRRATPRTQRTPQERHARSQATQRLDVAFRLKRNKALANGGDWYFAAVDGHEFFRQPQTLLPRMPDPHPHDSG